jgi:hypothetical protein
MNIVITNRQRAKKINPRKLKEIAHALLVELEVADAELGINLVGEGEMALVNETFLQPGDQSGRGRRDGVGQRNLSPA